MTRSLAVTLVAALALRIPAAAQAPGYQQLDTRQIMAEFHAEVLAQLNDLMAEWDRAWASDDVDALTGLYWDNAVLIPVNQPPARGEAAIRGYFETHLPLVGSAETFMLDFDASGGMATIFGNYLIEVQTGPRAGTSMSGPIVTVFRSQGRTWRIRSQVFVEGGG